MGFLYFSTEDPFYEFYTKREYVFGSPESSSFYYTPPSFENRQNPKVKIQSGILMDHYDHKKIDTAKSQEEQLIELGNRLGEIIKDATAKDEIVENIKSVFVNGSNGKYDSKDPEKIYFKFSLIII